MKACPNTLVCEALWMRIEGKILTYLIQQYKFYTKSEFGKTNFYQTPP